MRLAAHREDPCTGESERTTESYLVFVAIEGEGQPQPAPELTAETDRGRELRRRALDGES